MDPSTRPVRGRFAPSPTGPIHLGNARTALTAWLSARSQGGAFVMRLEDLDGPRVVPGLAEAQRRDLAWLGLDWDEGPDVGGPHAPYEQSARDAAYVAALCRLEAAGHLFPCRLSRRELQEIASAPHGPDASPYPQDLRPDELPAGWLDRVLAGEDRESAVRFRVDEEPVSFVDRVVGPVTERVDLLVGDFVLRRRDGQWAYQLAVVVDDLAMGITEVVRGADLLDSTARQIQLAQALGGDPAAFAHVPLVVLPDGVKLSKRERSVSLGGLREAGVGPERVVGWMAWTLGLLDRPEPCHPADLIDRLAWDRISREPTVVPPEGPEALRSRRG